jgi:hypothetical protein
MDALREAVGSGFHDMERLRTEAKLEPLRLRDDFKRLLATRQ